jgi:hypothetical protein
MSDVERLFSRLVDTATVPSDRDWASRHWRVARDHLDRVGPLPDDGILDVIGLLLDELEKWQSEVERLRAAMQLCEELARGKHHEVHSHRCDAIWCYVSGVLSESQGKEVRDE